MIRNQLFSCRHVQKKLIAAENGIKVFLTVTLPMTVLELQWSQVSVSLVRWPQVSTQVQSAT